MFSVVRHLDNHCVVDSQIVCAKVREGDQRIVRIKEGDPRGRHVVIVDDLVQSGGTLIECQVWKFWRVSLFCSLFIFHFEDSCSLPSFYCYICLLVGVAYQMNSFFFFFFLVSVPFYNQPPQKSKGITPQYKCLYKEANLTTNCIGREKEKKKLRYSRPKDSTWDIPTATKPLIPMRIWEVLPSTDS